MARKFTYSIANGSIERLTQQQTHDIMDESLTELEDYCDVDFVRVNSGGNYRFSFRNEWDMVSPALGNAWKNGTIHIASKTAKDRWRMDLPFRRTLQTVTQHEVIAHCRPWLFGHTTTRLGILGTSANSPGPLPAEVKLMQAKIGKPKKTFYPLDRRMVALKKQAEGNLDQQFQDLKVEREELRAATVGLTGPAHTAAWKKVHAKHKEVLRVLNRLRYYHSQWWAANNHWAGVPMAHVAGAAKQALESEGIVFPQDDEFTLGEELFLSEEDSLYEGEGCVYIDEDYND
jgi:hypothetical protein